MISGLVVNESGRLVRASDRAATGSIHACTGRLESEWRQLNQCLIKFWSKNPLLFWNPNCQKYVRKHEKIIKISVLRIRDVYLGSRIQNGNKKVGWKIICCHTFFCSHKFHKIENYFIFEMLKEKIWANFQRIINFLSKKLTLSSQKYGLGIRDPRSGIRTKTYSGSRIQGSKRPRIPDPDPQHCKISWQSCRTASPPRTQTVCSGWTALSRPPPICCGCSSSGSPLPPQERKAVRRQRRRRPIGGGCTRRETDERTAAAPHQEWDRRIFFCLFEIILILRKKLQHWLLLVL
jgi:hypothetical protein